MTSAVQKDILEPAADGADAARPEFPVAHRSDIVVRVARVRWAAAHRDAMFAWVLDRAALLPQPPMRTSAGDAALILDGLARYEVDRDLREPEWELLGDTVREHYLSLTPMTDDTVVDFDGERVRWGNLMLADRKAYMAGGYGY
jgi:hypothetical protein